MVDLIHHHKVMVTLDPFSEVRSIHLCAAHDLHIPAVLLQHCEMLGACRRVARAHTSRHGAFLLKSPHGSACGGCQLWLYQEVAAVAKPLGLRKRLALPLLCPKKTLELIVAGTRFP